MWNFFKQLVELPVEKLLLSTLCIVAILLALK
jgi:hypothetical protein